MTEKTTKMNHPNCYSCGVNCEYSRSPACICANCGKSYFAPSEQRTFPIVYDTWTEYERGWGSRPDGMSLHLNAADHKAFVADFNARHNTASAVPNEYTMADDCPKVVDVPESLYQRLVELKAGGKLGMFVDNRGDEKLIREGKDPFVVRNKLFNVIMDNVDGKPCDPEGKSIPFEKAAQRASLLKTLGIQTTIVESH